MKKIASLILISLTMLVCNRVFSQETSVVGVYVQTVDWEKHHKAYFTYEINPKSKSIYGKSISVQGLRNCSYDIEHIDGNVAFDISSQRKTIDGVVYNYQLLIDGSHCGGGGFIYFNKP